MKNIDHAGISANTTSPVTDQSQTDTTASATEAIFGLPAIRGLGEIVFLGAREGFVERVKHTPVVFSIGESKNATEWYTEGMPLLGLIEYLGKHKPGKKGGIGITQGSLIGATPRRKGKGVGVARTEQNVKANSLILHDFDGGAPVGEVIAKLYALGHGAHIWTSPSHCKTETTIRCDSLPGIEPGAATLDDVKTYLRDVKGYHVTILDTLAFRPEVREVDGHVNYVVTHAPMPKYRVMRWLKTPFDFGEGEERTARLLEWSGKYKAVGDEVGVTYDKSCCDPPRFMYTPVKLKDSDVEHFIYYLDGGPVDLDAYEVEVGSDGPRPMVARAEANGSQMDIIITATITVAASISRAASTTDRPTSSKG